MELLRKRIVTLAVVALALRTPVVFAADRGAPTVTGKLSRLDGIDVLKVWGTAKQRGYAHGYLLGPRITGLIDRFFEGGELGGPQMHEVMRSVVMKRMKIDPRYEQELRGLIDGMEARNDGPVRIKALERDLAYEDLVALNCLPDSSMMGCSSMAAWGKLTRDGKTLAARNLDWHGAAALDGSQVLIVHLPDESGRLAWVSVAWPGFVGCLTGMNAEGVTVAMHDVFGALPEATGGFTPRAWALRDAIESAHAATAEADVAGVLRARLAAVGNNVPVAAPLRGSGVPAWVFEYDGQRTKTGGITIRADDGAPDAADPSPKASYLVCTNHYRARDKAASCDRYERLSKGLMRAAREGKRLDVSAAFDLMRDVTFAGGERRGIITYQTVVFEPNAMRMHVALSRDAKPAIESKPVIVNVKAWTAVERNSNGQ